jgi:hypothetical protein
MLLPTSKRVIPGGSDPCAGKSSTVIATSCAEAMEARVKLHIKVKQTVQVIFMRMPPVRKTANLIAVWSPESNSPVGGSGTKAR